MSFLVRSFLSLIPLPFRHHHCFLESQKTFHFGLLQKGPKCCSLHMKVLSPRHEVPARKRMNDRKKKKKKDTLGTTQIHSMKQYWKVGRGLFQIFLFFFFLYLPSFLINATPFTSTRKHRQPRHHSCPCPPQKNSAVRRTVWLWKAFPEILN